MKRQFAFSIVLLLASLPSFASHAQPSPFSQIRPKHARPASKRSSKTVPHPQGALAHRPLPTDRQAGKSRTPTHPLRARRFGGGSVSNVGLVSASQIPMGGADDGFSGAVMGDFNGDGKQDIARLVYTADGDSTVYSISVILSNGDGTFQAAQLTSTPSNTDDPIIVGDVDRDGKDDILMVHPPSDLCGAARKTTPGVIGCGSTVDVLLSNGDGTFTLGNNYLISNFDLNGGLLTDINSDGKLDILAIDVETPAKVISVPGNGDGTFGSPTTFATLSGPAPSGINFADFNGDGKLDFEGEDKDNQVMVYLASGSGTFAAPVALVTSDDVYDSCGESTGDLTGDGKPEIVSVNCGDNTITIFVNNSDGSFQPGVYYDNAFDTYVYPGTAAIADVNNDGSNDILVANYYGGSITVFLGNGDGTVAVPTVGFDTGGFPFDVPLVADFNGDGLPDVIESDDLESFSYLPGYGDGTFRAGLSYGLPGSFTEYTYTNSVAAGDFNGDGFADIVAINDGNTIATGVAVYLSNGDGTLKPPVTYGTSSSLEFVTVADFNGDGKLDIAATDYNAGVVQIFLGRGDGTFTVGQTFPTDTSSGPEPEYLVAGDFDHDGNIDLAIVNSASDTIGVLLGQGDGTFGAPATYAVSSTPNSLTAADLNGDGYLDLAVPLSTDSGNLVAVFLANSDKGGTFKAEADVATGTGSAEDVAFGDFNGDGKIDMAVTVQSGPIYPSALVVALGKGDGTFLAPSAYPSSARDGGTGNAALANLRTTDLNGDGNLDLLYVSDNYGTIGIMFGGGDGTFSSPVEFPAGGYIFGLALADVNGDGSTDVVTGNYYTGGVNVLLNGNGSGTAPNYTLGTQTPSSTVSAGSPATYDLALAGDNFYKGTISLACTGGLPTGAACSFSPASVIAHGNQPLSSTLTISTTAAASAMVRPVRPNSNPGAPMFLASLGGLGLFGLVLAAGAKNRVRLQMGILLGVVLLATMLTLVGCDNDSSATTTSMGTPPGSYTVVVTSTGTGAGAPTHTVSLTLVVQ